MNLHFAGSENWFFQEIQQNEYINNLVYNCSHVDSFLSNSGKSEAK